MPEIERLFSSLDAVEQAADEVRHGQKGHLTLATVGNLATSLVATAIAAFLEKHPRIRVEIHALSTRRVVHEVLQQPGRPRSAGCAAGRRLFGEHRALPVRTACVVPKRHPLARKSEVTPLDLADQRIISFADDTMTGWMLREAFRAKGVPYPIRIVTNQTMTACVLARKGVGVALVDTFPLLPNVPPTSPSFPSAPPSNSAPSSSVRRDGRSRWRPTAS